MRSPRASPATAGPLSASASPPALPTKNGEGSGDGERRRISIFLYYIYICVFIVCVCAPYIFI